MFDIGFFELLIIAIVGLVVIGPERLPETVRAISLWIGRLKRSLRETRSEIEKQIGADDIRRQLHNENVMRSLEKTRQNIEEAVQAGTDATKDIAKDIGEHLWGAMEPGSMTSAVRLHKAATGHVEESGRSYDLSNEMIANFLGMRVQSLDVVQAVGFKAGEYSRGAPDANRQFTEKFTTRGTVSPEEIYSAYVQADARRRELFNRMHEQATAAIRLGATQEQVESSIHSFGIAQKNVDAIIAGRYTPYGPSEALLANAESNSGESYQERLAAVRRAEREAWGDDQQGYQDHVSVIAASKARQVVYAKDESAALKEVRQHGLDSQMLLDSYRDALRDKDSPYFIKTPATRVAHMNKLRYRLRALYANPAP